MAFLRRHWGRLAILLILMALGALIVVRKLRGAEVSVARAQRSDLRQTVVASGRVLAPARIKLGSLTLARVRQVAVEEGQAVKKGALLVQLDDDDARASLKQAQAQVARARAQFSVLQRFNRRLSQQSVQRAQIAVDEAEAELKRKRALAKSGATTAVESERAERQQRRARSQLQTALTEALNTKRGGSAYRVALASLAEAQAAQQRAEVALTQLALSAPVDGTIVERSVEVGDVVPAGQTLLVLAKAGPKQLLIEPDEKNLALLKVGQEGKASTDARPDESFAVRVETIVPAVDRATGTFRVKLAVPRAPASLVSDMTVSVEIVVARKQNVMLLPRAAIRDLAAAKPYVLTIEGRYARRRNLTLGIRGDERVQVRAGIDVGQPVILPTARPVLAGDRVRARR